MGTKSNVQSTITPLCLHRSYTLQEKLRVKFWHLILSRHITVIPKNQHCSNTWKRTQFLHTDAISAWLLVMWAGPRMAKGQLSRVPWPGNSWMPFTFQPALRALQQPQKHSHSLQLATDTELAHHYIQ